MYHHSLFICPEQTRNTIIMQDTANMLGKTTW